MTLAPVTADDMHAAQILTGATMALWMLAGLAPGLRAYATRLRIAILSIYLLGCAAFASYFLLFR